MLLRNNSTRSAHLLQIVQRRIGRSPGIPDACGIEKIAGLCSAVDGILIQTVAVQVPSSHSQIIVTTLYKILGRIHVAVDIESFALQIVKFLVVSLIIMPVRKVLSMGEDDSNNTACTNHRSISDFYPTTNRSICAIHTSSPIVIGLEVPIPLDRCSASIECPAQAIQTPGAIIHFFNMDWRCIQNHTVVIDNR